MQIIYRNIKKVDVETYWELRLSGLKNSPDAFGSSYEESVGRSLEEAAKRINEAEDNYILGAFDGDRAIGMVGFMRESAMKMSHKAFIWGVYLYPEYRGKGIARKLMEDVLTHASSLAGLRQVKLDVATHNESAKKLYSGLGFETYGVEKDALFVDEKFIDEEMMVKFL